MPGGKIVELKSLKLYLNSFRDAKISHEGATNVIFSELKKPSNRKTRSNRDFNARGNVKTAIRVCM